MLQQKAVAFVNVILDLHKVKINEKEPPTQKNNIYVNFYNI